MSLYTGIHVVLSDLNQDQVIGSHDSPDCLSKIFTSAADKLSLKILLEKSSVRRCMTPICTRGLSIMKIIQLNGIYI